MTISIGILQSLNGYQPQVYSTDCDSSVSRGLILTGSFFWSSLLLPAQKSEQAENAFQGVSVSQKLNGSLCKEAMALWKGLQDMAHSLPWAQEDLGVFAV